jgi:hypothetical protein
MTESIHRYDLEYLGLEIKDNHLYLRFRCPRCEVVNRCLVITPTSAYLNAADNNGAFLCSNPDCEPSRRNMVLDEVHLSVLGSYQGRLDVPVACVTCGLDYEYVEADDFGYLAYRPVCDCKKEVTSKQ